MKFSLVLHIIGLALWVGGLMFIPRMMTVASLGPVSDAFKRTIKRTFIGYVLSGLILSTVSGVVQLSIGGVAQYMQQGWMHMKLTFVLALYLITGILALKVFGLSDGSVPKRSTLMALHGAAALCLVLIVSVTFLLR